LSAAGILKISYLANPYNSFEHDWSTGVSRLDGVAY